MGKPSKFLKVRVVKMGEHLRMAIPPEVAESLNIKEGDVLGVTTTNHEMLVKKMGYRVVEKSKEK